MTVATVALGAAVVGVWGVARLARYIASQMEGKCDYMPCVGPWTLPLLSGFALLLVVGVLTLAWLLYGKGGLLRRDRSMSES